MAVPALVPLLRHPRRRRTHSLHLVAAGFAAATCAAACISTAVLDQRRHSTATGFLGFQAPLGTRRLRSVTTRNAVQTVSEGVTVEGDLQPLSNYVLVRPKEAITTMKSGLILPTSKEKPCEGEVIAVGPGEIDEDTGKIVPLEVTVGTKVLYSKYGGETVKVGDVEHVLVQDSDVLLSYTGEEATLEDITMPRHKVLIRLRVNDKKTTSGLLLSVGAGKSQATLGEIVSAGSGNLSPSGEVQPLDVSVGDCVKFSCGNEVSLELGKEDYRAVDVTDLQAKWRP